MQVRLKRLSRNGSSPLLPMQNRGACLLDSDAQPWVRERVAVNLLRFGLFELDLAAHELRRSGHRVHLQDMPLRVLQMLLERPNDLVTRAAFFERLWPHDASGILDDNLNTAIRKLRLALNDSAHHPRFIETVPKRGYRFVGSVELVQEPTSARQVDTSAADAAGARNGDIPPFNAAEMEIRNVPISSLLPLRLF